MKYFTAIAAAPTGRARDKPRFANGGGHGEWRGRGGCGGRGGGGEEEKVLSSAAKIKKERGARTDAFAVCSPSQPSIRPAT